MGLNFRAARQSCCYENLEKLSSLQAESWSGIITRFGMEGLGELFKRQYNPQ